MKRTLQHLEVLEICMFAIDVEFDLVHGNIHVYAIIHLA